MQPNKINSIRSLNLVENPLARQRRLLGRVGSLSFAELFSGQCAEDSIRQLCGHNVLIATESRFMALRAIVELDGVVSRMIICPTEAAKQHFDHIVKEGDVEAVVCESKNSKAVRALSVRWLNDTRRVVQTNKLNKRTEWILLTSGTTGHPKLVIHNLLTLSAAIPLPTLSEHESADDTVWGTFYDVRRYGGLQIFLRSILNLKSLVLSEEDEPLDTYLERLGAADATHISGTPSHWRRVLMNAKAHAICPSYIRLSGEIADQGILSALRKAYSEARISHAFASTEAGVVMEVTDELEGFPMDVHPVCSGSSIRIHDGCLFVKSNGAALGYIGEDFELSEEGYLDTGDAVGRRGDRYYFLGRKNGVISVGGQKLHPEEVEAVINRHPSVRMSVVQSYRSSILGSLVAAEVLPNDDISGDDFEALKQEIRNWCRQHLSAYKVPSVITRTNDLRSASSGKLARSPRLQHE